jgi:hypothetical protein
VLWCVVSNCCVGPYCSTARSKCKMQDVSMRLRLSERRLVSIAILQCFRASANDDLNIGIKFFHFRDAH